MEDLLEEKGSSNTKLWTRGVVFSERELRLINNARSYAFNDPAGLPGHNLMIIIDKLVRLAEEMGNRLHHEDVDACIKVFEVEESPH